MARFLSRIGLSAVALALIALPATAQVNVTGTWELNFQNPQGGSATMIASLTQEGTTVTGTIELSEVPEAEMSDGVVEDSTLSFQLEVLFDGQWYPLWVSGAVDGDTITGSIELPEGAGTIPFTGARTEGGG